MAQIKITLVNSPIGRIPAQRKTVKALGLGKLNSSVVKEGSPAILGMVNSISHLVKVAPPDRIVFFLKKSVSNLKTCKFYLTNSKDNFRIVKCRTNEEMACNSNRKIVK